MYCFNNRRKNPEGSCLRQQALLLGRSGILLLASQRMQASAERARQPGCRPWSLLSPMHRRDRLSGRAAAAGQGQKHDSYSEERVMRRVLSLPVESPKHFCVLLYTPQRQEGRTII